MSVKWSYCNFIVFQIETSTLGIQLLEEISQIDLSSSDHPLRKSVGHKKNSPDVEIMDTFR